MRKVITSCSIVLHNSIEDVLDMTDMTDGTFLGGDAPQHKARSTLCVGELQRAHRGSHHRCAAVCWTNRVPQRTWFEGTVSMMEL